MIMLRQDSPKYSTRDRQFNNSEGTTLAQICNAGGGEAQLVNYIMDLLRFPGT